MSTSRRTNEEIGEIWNLIDKNEDGQITRGEIEAYLRKKKGDDSIGMRILSDTLKEVLRLQGTWEGRQMVTRSEFIKMYREAEESMAEAGAGDSNAEALKTKASGWTPRDSSTFLSEEDVEKVKNEAKKEFEGQPEECRKARSLDANKAVKELAEAIGSIQAERKPGFLKQLASFGTIGEGNHNVSDATWNRYKEAKKAHEAAMISLEVCGVSEAQARQYEQEQDSLVRTVLQEQNFTSGEINTVLNSVLHPLRVRKIEMRKAAKLAGEFERTMATGTFEERMEALTDPTMGEAESDGKISVAFTPERLKLLLQGRFVIPLFGLRDGLLMPSWKEDLVNDIKESCMGYNNGACLTFVMKASQIFCKPDDQGCYNDRMLDNHAVSLFRHLLVGPKGDGENAAFPDAKFVIISGLTHNAGIDWSQANEEENPECIQPRDKDAEVTGLKDEICRSREADIDVMADCLMAICGCTSDDVKNLTDLHPTAKHFGAQTVSIEKQKNCFNRSSIFFDMAQRQQHLTTSLFRRHMMQQMLGGRHLKPPKPETDQAEARRQALALYQTSNLDAAPIQETMETLTCINILLQTGCNIHTVYFLGHYDGTLLIQKYIEGFYYGLYRNVEKMTMKKLSWATNDDLMDMCRYLSNSFAGCSEEEQQKARDEYNKRAHELNSAIAGNIDKKKTMESIYDEGNFIPPASSKPARRRHGEGKEEGKSALEAWKNQLPTVETAIKGSYDPEKPPDVCSGYTWRGHHSPRKSR